jgi:uncharacterized protein (DUF2336 family)
MSAGTTISNFAKLAALDSQKSSETRRELLREVTSVLDVHSHCTLAELNGIDEMLAAVASQFSTQVRREFARQVATSISGFGCFTEQLAMDEIEVSTVILQHSRSITNDVLLKVIKEKSDAHRMQVTARADLSEDVSDALVQHGSDEVVIALLKNETARIAVDTYEAVAKRANTNSALQSPLVRRKGVPLDVLQELYLQVEGELRQEIVSKFGEVAPDELERAFARVHNRNVDHCHILPIRRDIRPVGNGNDLRCRPGRLAFLCQHHAAAFARSGLQGARRVLHLPLQVTVLLHRL